MVQVINEQGPIGDIAQGLNQLGGLKLQELLQQKLAGQQPQQIGLGGANQMQALIQQLLGGAQGGMGLPQGIDINQLMMLLLGGM